MHMRMKTGGHHRKLAQVVRHAQSLAQLLDQRDTRIFMAVMRGQ